MKSKILRETILFYHLDEDMPKGRQLRKLAQSMGIRTVTITEKDLGKKLGDLAQGNSSAEGTDACPDKIGADEMLVFCGMSRSALDQYLSRLRSEGIESVALKAVLTGHNAAWSVRQLIAELKKEHELFENYRRLQGLMQLAEQLPDVKKAETELLLEECRRLTAEQETDIKKLGALADRLEELLSENDAVC